MTKFASAPDAFVVEKVRENFAFLTGERMPELKKQVTHIDGNTVEDHFKGGASFAHMVIFNLAVAEAKKRNLLNAVEVTLCDEVLKIMKEA